MPLRPIISKPSGKALFCGAGTFLLAYVISVIVLNRVLPGPTVDSEHDARGIMSLVLPLVLYLVSGFVTGFVARRSPFMHGALLGFLVALLFVTPWLVLTLIPASLMTPPPGGYLDESSWFEFLRVAIGAMLVCSLGAIFGDYFSNRRGAP